MSSSKKMWLGIALVMVGMSAGSLAAQDGAAPLPVPNMDDPESGSGTVAFDSIVIYTNIPGEPTAAVPGFPGVSFGPGTGTTHFDRVFGSPNGNWILTADTDLPTGSDEVLIANGVVGLFEGDPLPFAAPDTAGFLDTKVGINDTGDWVFATNSDGSTTEDEFIVKSTGGVLGAPAQEGGAIPVLNPPLSFSPATWGSTLESPVIAADGSVGFVSDSIGGGPTTENEIAVIGTTLLGQEGVTVPSGQIGTEFWDNFDVSDFWISADGSHWLLQGDLTGSTTSDDVVVVDGAVVIQESEIIAGSGFPNPVDGSGIVGVHMDAGGNWFARGNNDTSELDWVVRNGTVAATGGTPIYTGATEVWDDTDFSDCFYLHVGNAIGDWVIGGVTDAPSDSNGVLVANGTHEVVRESDPIDLDGNGVFDDDAFFDTFGNDDAFLSTGRILYLVATIKDGTGTRIGQGFFSFDLSSVPVELMSFDVE